LKKGAGVSDARQQCSFFGHHTGYADVMVRSWAQDPSTRPTFRELIEILKAIDLTVDP
jgi:hypothetical protein